MCAAQAVDTAASGLADLFDHRLQPE